MTKKIANVRIGSADTSPDKPSHTPGVKEGNALGNYIKQPGHLPHGQSTAARSTGINPEHRNPITPGAPNISPP